MVLVQVVQQVETRLLLLVGLERVAGLQIGVLHDPAGPGEEEGKGKHGVTSTKQLDTPFLCTSLAFLFL